MRATKSAMPAGGAAAPAASATEAADRGWRAALDLTFRGAPGRTVLARRAAEGPLQVQRPFYPEGEVCHLYLLHPPGGIVGGDRLEVSATLEGGARALLTTPAAGKFYRSAGAVARQSQRLRVAAGAALEWLPQETIVFDGALARSVTRIEAEEGGRFMAWEVLCLGRPAAGESFERGSFEQRLEVFRGGRPLLLECNRFEGGGEALRAPWGLGGHPVAASMVCSPCEEADVAVARAAIGGIGDGERLAATLVDGLLLLRFIGRRADRAREHLTRAWTALRPRCLGAAACRPRIWST